MYDLSTESNYISVGSVHIATIPPIHTYTESISVFVKRKLGHKKELAINLTKDINIDIFEQQPSVKNSE